MNTPPKKTILILDDDARIARAISLCLKSAGYNVVLAQDGITALMLVESKKLDLIISDIWMPVGAGFAFAYSLKKAASPIPIIFITSSERPKLRCAAEEFGAAGFLETPHAPAALLAAVALALATPSACPAPPKPESVRRASKILIVEDDEKIAAGLAIRLKAAGYEYDLAFDVWAGVIRAVHGCPDLIILDISLPQGTGFEVAERVRKLMPVITPMIFLSSGTQPELRKRAEEFGAASFFEKPYEAEDLLAAVAKALSETTSRLLKASSRKIRPPVVVPA